MQEYKQTATTDQLPQLPQLSRLVHDLNQPLSAISNYALAGILLIDKGSADSAQLKQLFEKIAAQCSRTTVLSQQLGKAVAAPATGKEPV